MNNATPIWIAVDGIDGSGKTTLISHIEQYLQKKAYPTAVTKAVGEGPIGKACRARLLNTDDKPCGEMQSIMLPMCFVETYYDYILPYMEKGNSVVTDRWTGSFMAYQNFAEEFPAANLMASFFDNGNDDKMNDFIDDYPDIYFICDVDVHIAEERMAKRAAEAGAEPLTRLDKESHLYKDKVRYFFKEYVAKKFPTAVLLDCSKSLEEIKKDIEKNIDAVLSQRCLDIILARFPLKDETVKGNLDVVV